MQRQVQVGRETMKFDDKQRSGAMRAKLYNRTASRWMQVGGCDGQEIGIGQFGKARNVGVHGDGAKMRSKRGERVEVVEAGADVTK